MFGWAAREVLTQDHEKLHADEANQEPVDGADEAERKSSQRGEANQAKSKKDAPVPHPAARFDPRTVDVAVVMEEGGGVGVREGSPLGEDSAATYSSWYL